jgi:ABC-type antimicrobial peptide transport system permease subunit
MWIGLILFICGLMVGIGIGFIIGWASCLVMTENDNDDLPDFPVKEKGYEKL